MEICGASSSKTERKIVERNRRNQMKILYSKLFSLLPVQPSQETPSLPDQIDEAISYIKRLQVKLERMNQKRESLVKKRRPDAMEDRPAAASFRPPEIKIHGLGHFLEVVFTCGLDDRSMFYEILRLIHEDESMDVVSASSSVNGAAVLHVVHAEMKNSETCSGFGAARISKRLHEFVYGSVSEEEPPSPGIWPLEIWDF